MECSNTFPVFSTIVPTLTHCQNSIQAKYTSVFLSTVPSIMTTLYPGVRLEPRAMLANRQRRSVLSLSGAPCTTLVIFSVGIIHRGSLKNRYPPNTSQCHGNGRIPTDTSRSLLTSLTRWKRRKRRQLKHALAKFWETGSTEFLQLRAGTANILSNFSMQYTMHLSKQSSKAHEESGVHLLFQHPTA